MPVCRYGGANCEAGPGAAGDSDTVNQHEIKYHNKPNHPRAKKGAMPQLLPKETRAILMKMKRQDPAEMYFLKTRGQATSTGQVPKTAKAKRKAVEEQKKRRMK